MPRSARHSLNAKQELFCKVFLATGIASQAYREAGYKHTSKSLTVCASKLLNTASVQQRLTELRNVKDARLARKDINKEALVERFWEIVHDPEAKRGESVQAGIAIAKMVGWNAPTRVEHDLGDRVRAYLETIRTMPLKPVSPRSAQVIEIEDNTP
jgi:phage terminase small subunit